MLGRKKQFFRRKAVSPPILAANEQLAFPHPEFDEAAYLKCNPDIAAWVSTDHANSGWKYFVEQGYLENRAGVSLAVCEQVRRAKTYEIDHLLPPEYLRKRVAHPMSKVSKMWAAPLQKPYWIISSARRSPNQSLQCLTLGSAAGVS
jgi:hypothetical protein